MKTRLQLDLRDLPPGFKTALRELAFNRDETITSYCKRVLIEHVEWVHTTWCIRVSAPDDPD